MKNNVIIQVIIFNRYSNLLGDITSQLIRFLNKEHNPIIITVHVSITFAGFVQFNIEHNNNKTHFTYHIERIALSVERHELSCELQ